MSKVAKTLRFIFAQSLEWADDNGWTDDACQNDRIVDWFGPSDFKAIKEIVERLEAPALPSALQGQDFAVPDGWQLVPKVLTEAMSAELNLTGSFTDVAMQRRYAAALDKAPAARAALSSTGDTHGN